MTQQELLKIAAISIGLRLMIGTLVVLLIQLQRRKIVINSLVSPEELIGLSGTVQIPFDHNSKGKIRVNVKGSLIDIVALSNASHDFSMGEQVVIIEAHENKIIMEIM